MNFLYLNLLMKTYEDQIIKKINAKKNIKIFIISFMEL